MPVSPRDFELYSRMTGAPMPSDAMSRMQMAPEVYEFTKNFARKPNLLEKTGNLVKNIGKSAVMAIGAPMVAESMAEQARMQEQLRNEQAKTDAEMVAVPESPEQQVDTPAMAKIRLGMEAEAQKQANRLEIQDRMDRRAAGGVVKTDLNPQQPTTADVYGQDYVPNQTASNIIDQKMVQGSQIEDKTPNVAEVLSESQDSMPISMFRPTQMPTTGALHAATPVVGSGFSDSGNEVNIIKGAEEELVGSGATLDKVQNFLKKMGGTDEGSKLDIALLAAMQDRDKKERFYLGANSGDPALDNSPLLDHPDIVGGEDDINLPGGMNTGSRTNLEDHYREMRRMDAMERNKQAINEIVEKTPSPSEMQVGRSPNVLAGKDQSTFEAIQAGIPQEERDAARMRLKEKTAKKRMLRDDFIAQFVEGAKSDIVRGARGNKSLGVTRIPATNGDAQVGFVLANKPLDQSPKFATTYGFGVAPGAESLLDNQLNRDTFSDYMKRGMKEAKQGKRRQAGEIFEYLIPEQRIITGDARLGDIVM